VTLEERSPEGAGGRCGECGAKLTDEEIATALEAGGPALCAVHAAEMAPLEGDDPADAGL